MKTLKTTGQMLRELRGPRSQQAIADAVGVTKMAICDYELDKKVPRDNIKVRLAKLYGKSVEELFFSQM